MPVDRLLADRGDELGREQRQLFGDQERIAAAAHVEHPLVVQIEAGLEAVVGAEDLQRQPSGHDLGDRGRDEGLVGVLRHQLVALCVHHQHQPRRSERRDFSLTSARALERAAEARRGASRRDHMADPIRANAKECACQ